MKSWDQARSERHHGTFRGGDFGIPRLPAQRYGSPGFARPLTPDADQQALTEPLAWPAWPTLVAGAVGWDLDGVICADPPRWMPLWAPLVAWHQRNARLLFVPWQGRIISGRLLHKDSTRTHEWLARHEIPCAVHLNPSSPAGATQHKIDTIRRFAITHYIESDADVARAIKDAVTRVHVYHWNPA